MTEKMNQPGPRFAGRFNPAETPLYGTNLIEAGAGTGKTYNIAALYVRLIVEAGIPAREILVVTYTVAATEELKDRIRRRIREALQAFQTGSGSDPFLAALIEKHFCTEERRRALERLTAALRDFDEAAIYTIHGFCRRVLQENAVGSGSLFDTELLADDQELKREIVEDFWRIHFYESLPEVMAGALERKYSPAALLKFALGHASHPDTRIVPEDSPPGDAALQALLEEFRRERRSLKEQWFASRKEVSELLRGETLKANIYGSRVPGLMGEMDRFLDSEGPSCSLFDGFVKFTPEGIEAAVKKDRIQPRHPVFEICRRLLALADRLREMLDRRFLFLKAELLRTIGTELQKRQLQRNILFFDDLLLRLRQALLKPGGRRLAGAIRQKYRAALIDEFQDTDPVQYAIFSAVFKTEGSILFLIGDPKQAIYSFRGADIFAYLKAASHVDAVYTLDANWRSSPALISAINTLFAHRENPFVFPEISFREAMAGDLPSRDELRIDGCCEPPLQWWFVAAGRDGEGDRPLAKGIARPRIIAAVAGEIARLIRLGREGRALLGERPLAEGDIAILVRTNREARLFRECLTQWRIPAVLHSTGNIFDSHEALEMERLLLAVASPDREDLLRAALATDMIGCDLDTLGALQQDERAWELRQEGFSNDHDLWRRGSFMRMFRRLMEREQVRTRLLSFPDGERRLTNMIHLAELLHGQESMNQPGMGGLLKWLVERRDAGTPRLEVHQLRLESDARAVRIVTIHKSKGMEYPVVFCPFAWGDPTGDDEVISFHDPVEHGQVYDLGSEDFSRHKAIALRENLAERVRLLYVALTRARNRCTFVWGRINDTETSAPAYLFHGVGSEEVVAKTDARFRTLSDAAMFLDLGAIARKAAGAIELQALPDPEKLSPLERTGEAANLRCREFTGVVDRSWRVASFSLLISGHFRNDELPDHDAGADEIQPLPETATDEGSDGIFAFPRGGRSGTLLHDILEHLDFTQSEESIQAGLIAAKLREHGFEDKWEKTICGLVRRILRHPLERAGFPPFIAHEACPDDSPRKDIPERIDPRPLVLASIGAGDRLNELAFHFPLKRITREKLSALFSKAGLVGPEKKRGVDRKGLRGAVSQSEAFADTIKRLHFDPVRGFMKGFVDMIFFHSGRFYLVDWKSNFLGARKEDYHRDRLATVMAEGGYILQYHLYTMALHRYLALRQPDYDYDAHFGGVYYLFLRGMDPAWGSDYGVYRDRPSQGLVELLCREMIDAG